MMDPSSGPPLQVLGYRYSLEGAPNPVFVEPISLPMREHEQITAKEICLIPEDAPDLAIIVICSTVRETRQETEMEHGRLAVTAKTMRSCKTNRWCKGQAAALVLALIAWLCSGHELLTAVPSDRVSSASPVAQQNEKAASPKTAQPGTGPSVPDKTRSERLNGGLLFNQKCSECHGSDGKGMNARQAMPDIPDFTRTQWQKHHSTPQIKVTIRDGKADSMPAFGPKLSAVQIEALVEHIRTFGPVQQEPPASTTGEFEQRFNELQAELQALQQEFVQSLLELEDERPNP
jgi:mono/diheme cytochrome c family protein